MRLIADRTAVRVPATSANLGPGFDAFGLALALHDVVEVRAVTGASSVHVQGEGAGEVPDGEDHLVIRAIRAGLEYVGAPQAGLELRCTNAIPHGRGLGSSAAAVVAGLVAARALVSEPEALDDTSILGLATDFEGHPDNAAPALLGAATIAWIDHEGPRAVRLPVLEAISATVLVPQLRLSTSKARSTLPGHVPHRDAAANAGRSGLLTLALTQRPDLLLAATEDRLHQAYRASVMPESIALVERLRERGHAAVVSGAGPSVLVLHGVEGDGRDEIGAIAGPTWRSSRLAVGRGVEITG
ncbi:homoserine kinase [Pseudactinotalea suaedae]|uniref:homoserine kinase n=1 Tax=Pseudactinotalea suaedae TaxID=1524924 RepID=UPI0018843582|nr:homoserine kinase [Pseudactinotalea suaedae]